jgi:hypothetical protein
VPCLSTRRLIAAAGFVLAAAVLAGGGFLLVRGPVDSDYFGPNMPTWVRVPTTIGDPVYVGVLLLRAQPGDAVELDSLLVEGLIADTGVAPMVRILHGETRILGGISESDLGDTIDLSSYGSLSMLRFSETDGPVELAVRVVGTAPVHGFDGLRLRFRISGAAAVIEDWIPMRASICTGSTFTEAVERCRPIAEQMESEGP